MGYNTQFAIKVRGVQSEPPAGDMTGIRPVSLEQLAENLEEATYDSFYVYDPSRRSSSSSSRSDRMLSSLGSESFIYCYEAKWYDHEEDLDNLSARYPNLEFWVLGLGDDALFGDIWCQVYRKGIHSEKDYRMASIWDVKEDDRG